MDDNQASGWTAARLPLASENSEARALPSLLGMPRAATAGLARGVVRRVTELAIACGANQQPDDLRNRQRGV